jgi:hypothetical protein
MSDEALIRLGGGAMAGSEPSPGTRARIVSPIDSCLSRACDIGPMKRRHPSPDSHFPTPDNRISPRHATTIWPDAPSRNCVSYSSA